MADFVAWMRGRLGGAGAWSPAWGKIAAAALLVALLAGWNIHSSWGLAGGSAVRAQAKLQASAEQKLVGVGADWARVVLDGQGATIVGQAPAEADLYAARGAVRSAAWTGGAILGGVTRVRSDGVEVSPPREGPYAWGAVLAEDAVTLTGAAPTREDIPALGALAGALFPDRRVVNALTLDPVPPGAGWTDAARGALAVLARLETGEARLSDFELTVTGQAASPEAAGAARTGMARLEGVISALSSIEVTAPRPAPPPPEPEPEPQPAVAAAPAAPAPEPQIDPVAACQARFDEVLAQSVVRFEVASAQLEAESLPLIDRLAQVAAACPDFALRVEGHTDETGSPETNMALSERRAGAVVERLSALGVAEGRLVAVGMGALRPEADNATEEGRQANRRIEIIVQR